MAYEEGLLRENIARKLVRVKGHGNKREYLTKEELVKLSKANCKSDVLRRAGLFSCMTGLRLSDCILLRWENIKKSSDGGWVLDITTKKTKTDATIPISEEALALCGERGEGQVFRKLTPSVVALNLKDWIGAAGITKHITFHCFRHTFATLQLAGGTDIYTVSKLLTHSNLATTQVYAEVVNELKRDAAERISLKEDAIVNTDDHHSDSSTID
jgi:integrase